MSYGFDGNLLYDPTLGLYKSGKGKFFRSGLIGLGVAGETPGSAVVAPCSSASLGIPSSPGFIQLFGSDVVIPDPCGTATALANTNTTVTHVPIVRVPTTINVFEGLPTPSTTGSQDSTPPPATQNANTSATTDSSTAGAGTQAATVGISGLEIIIGVVTIGVMMMAMGGGKS